VLLDDDSEGRHWDWNGGGKFRCTERTLCIDTHSVLEFLTWGVNNKLPFILERGLLGIGGLVFSHAPSDL
jgi:hypothetical protein